MNALSSLLKFIGNRLEHIQGGYLSGQTVNANSYLDRDVTFPKAYSTTPIVLANIASTSTAGAVGSISVAAINITTTGFTLRVFNAGSANRSPALQWIAIP